VYSSISIDAGHGGVCGGELMTWQSSKVVTAGRWPIAESSKRYRRDMRLRSSEIRSN
jgi:hypothetical protein